MTEQNGGDDELLSKKQKMALHTLQVEQGLLPPDSPKDFVIPEGGLNEQGLPWWFPPDFKAFEVSIDGRPAESLDGDASFHRRQGDEVTPDGTPVNLAWDYFDHDMPAPVTRASIEQEFNYRVTDLKKPSPMPPPKRIWSDAQMDRIRRGYNAQVMEEKWHGFMEGDRLFICRSWTGILNQESEFTQVPKGWIITKSVVESDLDIWPRGSDAFEAAQLESIIFQVILGKYDEKLEKRFYRELTKNSEGPKLVVTTAGKLKVPIEKPGYSVKHGKLADQHPLQREAYDKAFAIGFQSAIDAIVLKGMTEEDIYYSAQWHEKVASGTVAIESSRHAGLAKGAKMAAYKYHQEKFGISGSKSPSGEAWIPITDHSDAGLSKALNGLSESAWGDLTGMISRFSGTYSPNDSSLSEHATGTIRDFVQRWYDHGLVIDFNWLDWGRFGKGSKFSPEKAVKSVQGASAEDALRLMTALIRGERFSDGAWDRALTSGLFVAILHRLLQWRKPTRP